MTHLGPRPLCERARPLPALHVDRGAHVGVARTDRVAPLAAVLVALALTAGGFGCGSGGGADGGLPDADGSPDGVMTPDAPVGDGSGDAAPADASADFPPLADGGGDAGGDGGGGDGGGSCGACSAYGEPTVAGTVQIAEVAEASGLAASRINPGVLYTHNDSGDGPRFFAIEETGGALGEFVLGGDASANDWEAMAVGPCPEGSCVFLGDIGDNNAVRDVYTLYRVPEPAVAPGNPVGTVEVTFVRMPFRYPDGAHNAEALLVHPKTGRIYVVTKEALGQRSSVYRYPDSAAADTPVDLEPVVELGFPKPGDTPITGGDIHPCQDRVLLRTYGRLHELVADGAGAFEAVFAAVPVEVPVAAEGQGETVAYAQDGRGYFTLSEGAAQPLHRTRCE